VALSVLPFILFSSTLFVFFLDPVEYPSVLFYFHSVSNTSFSPLIFFDFSPPQASLVLSQIVQRLLKFLDLSLFFLFEGSLVPETGLSGDSFPPFQKFREVPYDLAVARHFWGRMLRIFSVRSSPSSRTSFEVPDKGFYRRAPPVRFRPPLTVFLSPPLPTFVFLIVKSTILFSVLTPSPTVFNDEFLSPPPLSAQAFFVRVKPVENSLPH